MERRVWAEPGGRTLGFIKSCANLTQIVIPCSGHMVPSCQPESSLEMVNNFVLGRGFATYDPLHQDGELEVSSYIESLEGEMVEA